MVSCSGSVRTAGDCVQRLVERSAPSDTDRRQASQRMGNSVSKTDTPINQRFRDLDGYLAYLEQTQGPVDGPWYKEVSPGVYELQTGNLRLDVPGKEKRVFHARRAGKEVRLHKSSAARYPVSALGRLAPFRVRQAAMTQPAPLDIFRRVLAGAARAIARDAEIEVAFASDAGTASGKVARVPSPGPGLERRLVAEARGGADALALRLRHHDARLHAANAPARRRGGGGVRCAGNGARRGAWRAGDGRGARQPRRAGRSAGAGATRSSARALSKRCRWRPRSA